MKVKKNNNWKKEMEMLVSERLGQIYRKIIKRKEIYKIKKKEEEIEQKLEELLKKETRSGFELYCDYEEVRSEHMNNLINTYYKEGVKDGIKLIIRNI